MTISGVGIEIEINVGDLIWLIVVNTDRFVDSIKVSVMPRTFFLLLP